MLTWSSTKNNVKNNHTQIKKQNHIPVRRKEEET